MGSRYVHVECWIRGKRRHDNPSSRPRDYPEDRLVATHLTRQGQTRDAIELCYGHRSFFALVLLVKSAYRLVGIMDQDHQAQFDSLKRDVIDVDKRLSQIEHSVNDDPKLNLRLIRIKRTTDIAAFVALILSAITMYLTLQPYFRGPNLKLISPRQIVLYNSDLFKPKIDFGSPSEILFAAITGYANRASKDHAAIVVNEFIRVTVGPITIQHWLYDIGNSEFRGPFEFQTHENRPIPFIVDGNNGFSHEVLFQPLSKAYCLPADHECTDPQTRYSWKDFIQDLRRSHRIDITLGAELDNRTPSSVNCLSQVHDDKINILANDGKVAVDCERTN